ncbi:MAG TPA: TolC family protein [Telluria sp.]
MVISRSLGRLRPLAAGAAALALLNGCASFSDDGGLGAVSAIARERTGHEVALAKPGTDRAARQSAVSRLLSRPLTPDTAVQVALLNNRGLQASLAQLGIAEADLVQAGRMRNPSISFHRFAGGNVVEVERGILFDIVGLLTMPARSNIEQRRFATAQLQAGSAAVSLAVQARKAYFNAVAAQQLAHCAQQAYASAKDSAELASRMAAAGNLSKLDQLREQVFEAGATAQLARARHTANSTREQLTRLLGVGSAGTAFALPDRLPELPASPRTVEQLEARALQERLDVQMAKLDTEMTASALGLSKATGFINVLHAGYLNKNISGAAREDGYAIELELPIFDWGRSSVAKAEAIYMQSVERTADTALRARSEAREAYSAYRATFDLARHYLDQALPLRRAVSDEVLLRYKGKQTGLLELLDDAREQASTDSAAIEAQRDFWLADTELQSALTGTGSSALP